jgi:excisionase family DNA binding protein
MPGAIYEPEDAAAVIGRSRRTLDRLRKAGLIRATKLGGRVLYRQEHLDAYLAERDKVVPPGG